MSANSRGTTVGFEADTRELKRIFQGELIRPGESGYDEGRAVWNGMIDQRPALIARCDGVADVIEAVNFARTNDLPVAVRGGGHNVAGMATCDAGLVIDLSLMKGVDVRPETRLARAEGGVTWGELDRATQEFGLATTGGLVSETGIAGLTLGGGFGWLRGKYGLSCDNLVSVEIVTAAGQFLKANERENQDLFWGIRGGGGNFGIVTAFEFRLHPVGPEVMLCFVFHNGHRMKEALQFYREYCATVPDEVSPVAACGVIPRGAEAFPEAIQGTPFVLFAACYIGPADQGKQVLQPLRDFSEPLVDFSGVMPYVEAQSVFDDDYPARELRYYWKSLNLDRLSDDAIDRIVDRARRQPSPLSTIDIWQVGGAVSRISEEDSAFSGRRVPFLLNMEANWQDPRDDAANIAWARQSVAALREFSDGSCYLNFPGLMEEGDAMIQATFGAKYRRLSALKKKFDPTNLFQLNQNIKPAG